MSKCDICEVNEASYNEIEGVDRKVTQQWCDECVAALRVGKLRERVAVTNQTLHPQTFLVEQERLAAITKTNWKQMVFAASTGPVDIAGVQATLMVDGKSVPDDRRVLLRAQLNPHENGIYLYKKGRLTRAPDARTFWDLQGAQVAVEAGRTFGPDADGCKRHFVMTTTEDHQVDKGILWAVLAKGDGTAMYFPDLSLTNLPKIVGVAPPRPTRAQSEIRNNLLESFYERVKPVIETPLTVEDGDLKAFAEFFMQDLGVWYLRQDFNGEVDATSNVLGLLGLTFQLRLDIVGLMQQVLDSQSHANAALQEKVLRLEAELGEAQHFGSSEMEIDLEHYRQTFQRLHAAFDDLEPDGSTDSATLAQIALVVAEHGRGEKL